MTNTLTPRAMLRRVRLGAGAVCPFISIGRQS
jgi:hypothetical protein